MKFAFIFLFISFSSIAGENCEAPSASTSSQVDELIPLFDAISWNHWAVSATEMENAPCKTKLVPDYETFISELSDSELETAYRDMVPSGQFPSDCSTVMCAVNTLWGAELGGKLLYMKTRHGYNGSEYAFQNSQRFTLPQINDVLKTLNDLPPSRRNLGWQGNQKLIVAARGVKHPTVPTATADSAIHLYDPWVTNTSIYMRQYPLFHEFAHNMGDCFNGSCSYLSDSEEWRRVSGCFVSNYGNTNASESMAESIAKYRYNGRGLKQSCPQKYEFLRTRIFDGVEYTDPTLCPQ